MTAKLAKDLKLSEKMITALTCTEPGDLMKPGPTRAALMRRRLVYSRASRPDRFGRITQEGIKVRDALLSGVGQ